MPEEAIEQEKLPKETILQVLPKEKSGESKLGLKLQEIRLAVDAEHKRLSSLLALPETQPESLPPPPSYPTTLPELDRSLLEKKLTPAEYLAQSGQLLRINEQHGKKIKAEERELASRIQELESGSSIVKNKIRELESQGTLKRLLGFRKKSRLIKEESQLENQLSGLKEQLQLRGREEKAVEMSAETVWRARTQVGQAEVEKSIQALGERYAEFYKGLLENKKLIPEIREIFINKATLPDVERLVREGQVTEEEKQQLVSSLKRFLTDKSPETQRELYQNKVRAQLDPRTDFGHVDEQAPEIIQRLTMDLVMADLQKFDDTVGHDKLEQKVKEIFEKAFPEQHRWFEWDRYGRPNLNLHLWHSIKSSHATQEIFGDLVNEKDRKFYQVILEESLSDSQGQFIDGLTHYPTPEAVRNLALLAAADYENYRTVHANWALTEFARRPNWKQILEETESKYPELKTARPVLEKWNWREYQTHPEIKEASLEFASSLLKGETKDKRITSLAFETLPASLRLDKLTQDGLVSKTDVATLKKAVSLLGASTGSGESFYFINALEKYSLETLMEKEAKPALKRLITLAQKINESENDLNALGYLSSYDVVRLTTTIIEDEEKLNLLLKAYEICPSLQSAIFRHTVPNEYWNFYLTEENLKLLDELANKYKEFEGNLPEVIALVGKELITGQRALELPDKVPDLLKDGKAFLLAVEFPETCLSTDKDIIFFKKALEKYKDFEDRLRLALNAVKTGGLKQEFVLLFPEQAKLLMGKMGETVSPTLMFIFSHSNELITEPSDIRFLNSLVGTYSKKADLLIKQYYQCIEAGVATPKDKELVLEFLQEIRVLSPMTFKGFLEAKQGGYEQVYVAELRQLAEKMGTGKLITENERGKPYYEAVLKHVYPNNSGNWTTYESSRSCGDRTGDLANFKLASRYEIDLLTGSEIRLEEGETLNTQTIEGIKNQILSISQKAEFFGYDNKKMLAGLDKEIRAAFQEVAVKGGLPGVDLDSISTREEKLFLLLADFTYGTKTLSPELMSLPLLKI